MGSNMILICNMPRKYSEISSEAETHSLTFSMMRMTSTLDLASSSQDSNKRVVSNSKRAKGAVPELMISSVNKMSLAMDYSEVALAAALVAASAAALVEAWVEAWGEACMISSVVASATSVAAVVDLLKCRPFPQAWAQHLVQVRSNLKLS